MPVLRGIAFGRKRTFSFGFRKDSTPRLQTYPGKESPEALSVKFVAVKRRSRLFFETCWD